MKRSRDGKRRISTVRRKCSILIPNSNIASGLPSRCDGREFKAGRCVEHYSDWHNARDARRIEAKQRREAGHPIPSTPVAIRVSQWIPKAERKWTKDPIRLMPNPKVPA